MDISLSILFVHLRQSGLSHTCDVRTPVRMWTSALVKNRPQTPVIMWIPIRCFPLPTGAKMWNFIDANSPTGAKMWIIYSDTRETTDNHRHSERAIRDAQRPFGSIFARKTDPLQKVDGLNGPQKPSKGLFGSLSGPKLFRRTTSKVDALRTSTFVAPLRKLRAVAFGRSSVAGVGSGLAALDAALGDDRVPFCGALGRMLPPS